MLTIRGPAQLSPAYLLKAPPANTHVTNRHEPPQPPADDETCAIPPPPPADMPMAGRRAYGAQRVLAVIRQAAEAGRVCPTNDAIGVMLGLNPDWARALIADLVNLGHLRSTNLRRAGRIFEIVATGAKTADPRKKPATGSAATGAPPAHRRMEHPQAVHAAVPRRPDPRRRVREANPRCGRPGCI